MQRSATEAIALDDDPQLMKRLRKRIKQKGFSRAQSER